MKPVRMWAVVDADDGEILEVYPTKAEAERERLNYYEPDRRPVLPVTVTLEEKEKGE